ncbi:MAG: VWA domain-containing protein [Candidatus Anstonellaceae archaeon]
MKGQSSLEQLIVIGAALAFIAIAFYLAASYSADSTRISQAQDAVGRLAAAADYVYALGPNSKEYVTVYLPDELASWNITGKVIVTKIYTSAGSTDVSAYSKADLVGTLPGYRGKQKILVEYLPSGKVRIGEAGLTCEPATISRTFNAGDSGSDTITVENTAAYNVTGIAAAISGGSGMASISSQPDTSLSTGASDTMSISYSIPADKASGAYGATVTVDSDNGGSCTTQITMNVNGVTTCATQCAALAYQSGSCRASAAACASNGEDYLPENDGSCSGTPSTPRCCCYPSNDNQGPLVTAVSSTANATAATNVQINATCNDTGRGDNYIASADIQVDFGGWNPASPSSGSFSSAIIQNVYRQVGFLAGGQHIAAVRCTDTANNTGPIAYYYFNITTTDTLGPIITLLTHSSVDNLAFSNVVETGLATDVYTGNSNIAACYVKLDNQGYQLAGASDGAYDSPTEGFTYDFGKVSANTHTVYAYCTDSLGNIGGVFTDTFGVAPADVMIAIESSNSMAGLMISASDSTIVTTTSTNYTLKKSLTLNQPGNPVNITTEMKTSGAGCVAYFEVRVGSNVVASGSTASTSYTNIVSSANLAGLATPYNLSIYMKSSSGSCTASNRDFSAKQQPTRIAAAQQIAGNFVDLASNTTQVGVVSFGSNANTGKTLTLLGSAANVTAVKNAINAITTQTGNICIACAIDNSVAELTSARGRYPNATRTIVLASDGPGDTGDHYASAATARDNFITIYTIGIGNSAISSELTSIAYMTGGRYYYAPDYSVLSCIFQHIGEAVPPC